MFQRIGNLACVVSLGLAACSLEPLPRGSGPMVAERRAVDAFSSLGVQSGLSATVTPAATPSVSTIGDENLVGFVEIEVSAGALTVRLASPYHASAGDPLRVEIAAPASLAQLSASEGAQVEAHGLAADALALEASGGATLIADGTAGRLDANLSGAAHLEARGVVAHDVEVGASGASLVEVCAQESLTLHLSGASHALFACGPSTLNSDLSGASTAQAE